MKARDRHKDAQLTRTSGNLSIALLVKHETMAAFTGPPTDSLLRSQRVLILTCSVIALLAVDVWRAPPPPPCACLYLSPIAP